jgi:hypothetical protein
VSVSLSDNGHIVVVGADLAFDNNRGQATIDDATPSAAPSLSQTTEHPTFNPIQNPIPQLVDMPTTPTASPGCCELILNAFRNAAAYLFGG